MALRLMDDVVELEPMNAFDRRVIGIDVAMFVGPLDVGEDLPALTQRRHHLPVVRQRRVFARLDRNRVDVQAQVDHLAVQIGVHGETGCGRRRQDVLLGKRQVIGSRLVVLLFDAGGTSQSPRQQDRDDMAQSGLLHGETFIKPPTICNQPLTPRRATSTRVSVRATASRNPTRIVR